MSARIRIAAAVLPLAAGALLACAQQPAPQESPRPARTDSLSGFVSVTGTGTAEQNVLRVPGGRAVMLLAMSWDSSALVRVAGAEIVVRGRDEGKRFVVETFRVRKVDGSPVADGTVQRYGNGVTLVTDAGTVPLGNPPAALRHMVGARVWIGGALDTGPNIYGVVAPAQ